MDRDVIQAIQRKIKDLEEKGNKLTELQKCQPEISSKREMQRVGSKKHNLNKGNKNA